MSCAVCEGVKDVTDEGGLYVLRRCEGCGRDLKLREPGAHGIGVKIRKGDRPVLPAGMLTFSANPLKSKGHFSRGGLHWFAELVFLEGLNTRRGDIGIALGEIREKFGRELKSSPKLPSFDAQDPEQFQSVFDALSGDKEAAEWFLFVADACLALAQDGMQRGEMELAVWATACAERFRSLHVFKTHFEEVVFMGHSAGRLTDLLRLWSANKENSDEGFWQIKFQENAFALSQLFAVPVTLIEGKAYVGGQGIDRKNARFVDFLLSGGASSEAIFVEIKTPATRLLRHAAYRSSVFVPSGDITGAVVQVLDYRATFIQQMGLQIGRNQTLSTFNPRCVVIAGNSDQLVNDGQRQSFELFRKGLANVEIITFDELFRKLEYLAALFNLKVESS